MLPHIRRAELPRAAPRAAGGVRRADVHHGARPARVGALPLAARLHAGLPGGEPLLRRGAAGEPRVDARRVPALPHRRHPRRRPGMRTTGSGGTRPPPPAGVGELAVRADRRASPARARPPRAARATSSARRRRGRAATSVPTSSPTTTTARASTSSSTSPSPPPTHRRRSRAARPTPPAPRRASAPLSRTPSTSTSPPAAVASSSRP